MYDNVLAILNALNSADGDEAQYAAAIDEAENLGEPLTQAIFSVALSRSLPEAIRTQIANSEAIGLNKSQIARKLSAELNDVSSLTEPKWDVLRQLLAHLRPQPVDRELLIHGQLQIDVLANWLDHRSVPRIERRLRRGLFTWTGRRRSVTEQLLSATPYLDEEISSLRPDWSRNYFVRTFEKTKQELLSGGPFVAGLAITCVFMTTVFLLWGSSDRVDADESGQQALSPAPMESEPAVAENFGLTTVFEAMLESEKLLVLGGKPIVVLPDPDAELLGDLLSQHHDGDVYFVKKDPGATPDGVNWLSTVDLPALGIPSELAENVVVAWFERSRLGRRVVFTHLAADKRLLSFAYRSDVTKGIVSFDSLVERANQATMQGNRDLAHIILRMAREVASSDRERGRVNLYIGVLLYNAGKPEADYAPCFRRAFVFLPESELTGVPKILRDTFRPDPGLPEQIDDMTRLKPQT